MDLTIRPVALGDIPTLMGMARSSKEKLKQLSILRDKLNRQVTGEHRITGQLDKVALALWQGEIVGYRHWYINSIDNGQQVDIGTTIKLTLSPHAQELVAAYLEYHYRENTIYGL